MTELHGFLDHLRENLEILDEQISHAREMSKSKEAGALQWAKTLRDLLELRNVTMDKIKSHLLGKDDTGATKEPLNFHNSDNHPLTLFERKVHDYLQKPWTVDNLKVKCEKCGIEKESTVTRHFEKYYTVKDYSKYVQYKSQDLCPDCYDSTLKDLYAEVDRFRKENGWSA